MSAETQKNQLIFIDTNILIYAYDRSDEKKHLAAVQWMEGCWENDNGCLSLQVLQEFYVNVTQKIPKRLDWPTARSIVSDLSLWHVHIPDVEDMLRAIDLQQSYSLSFWDAMILQSASRLGCKLLISEDFEHEQSYGEIRVINPLMETI